MKDFGGEDGIISDEEAVSSGYKDAEDLINKQMVDRTKDLLKDEDIIALLNK
jgi:hypothetical protein